MKAAFRQSMQWLHTWTGACFGWVIFLVFFNGTAAYFKQEITTWMKPEIGTTASTGKSIEGAIVFLTAKAPDAAAWTIHLPTDRNPVSEVSWLPPVQSGSQPVEDNDDRVPPDRRGTIGADGYPLAARETDGGDYFYQFHYGFHYVPTFLGAVLIWLASFALMTALTTGLISHRRIFAEFFTFRPRSGVRSWRDAHTMFAVLALPFHLMITYTGVAILVFFLMPWALLAHYSSPKDYYAELSARPQAASPTGRLEPLVSLESLLAKAETIWKGGHVETVYISNPGDETATVKVDRQTHDFWSGVVGSSLTFNGVTGEQTDVSTELSASARAATAVFNLHEAHFARPVLRWLLFLCGAIGTGMVATGLILWTAKRRHSASKRAGFRLVETLNVAVIAGYPAATAAYFLANRLLPVSVPDRADSEVLCAFGCWGTTLVWSILRRERRAWIEVLGFAALLFLVLPFVNAAMTARGAFSSLIQGDALYLGFDVTLLTVGLLFASVALWLIRQGPESTNATPKHRPVPCRSSVVGRH